MDSRNKDGGHHHRAKKGIKKVWIVTLRVIARRFVELMLLNIVFSIIAVILNAVGIISVEIALFWTLLVFSVIFMYLNIRLMRLCYYDLMDRLIHYTSNIAAYLLFAAVGYAVYFWGSNEWYAWLFAITKCANYSALALETPYSALIFHAVGILSVLVAPIGMRWVFLYGDREE